MNEPKITTITGSVNPKEIPGYVGENIAQTIYLGLLRAWDTPEIREDYERWKAERKARAATE